MTPRSIPTASWSTRATGARQFVVHEAFETMWCCPGSYASKLTPSATVVSGSVAGAEMITFCAPASRCLAASSRFVKKPVDSITTSAPRSPHGRAAGSRSESTLTSRPSTDSEPPCSATSPGNGPYTESYLSRCASVLESVMSLTATISMSALDSCAARNTLRPIRPKPLIPTRTDMRWTFLPGSKRPRNPTPDRVRLADRQPVHVAVLNLHEVVGHVPEVGGEVLGDRDRAMAAAGAPDRDHQMRLALRDVLGQEVVEQRHDAVVELVQAPVTADVGHDTLVEPGQRPQVRLVVRVGQEADVEGQVGVARRAVLVAEGGERHRELAGLVGLEQLARDLAAQRRGAQPGGVDRLVGALPDRGEQRDLGADPVRHVALRRERMAAARLLVAVDQRLLVRLEVDHPERDVGLVQVVDDARERGQIVAAARVAHHRGALDLRAGVAKELGQRADHLRRQVVHAEVARVLEDVHRRGLPRAGETGDEHQIPQVGGGARAVLAHGWSVAGHPDRNGLTLLAPRLVQVGVEVPRHLLREPGDALELLPGGGQHGLGRAEVLQKRTLAGRPDAREVVHDRLRHGLVAADAVVGDGKAVGLVAYALEQLELRRLVREHDRVGLPGK